MSARRLFWPIFVLLLAGVTLAGSETTRSAITGGLVALLDHPEQWDRLATDPAAIGTPAISVSTVAVRQK